MRGQDDSAYKEPLSESNCGFGKIPSTVVPRSGNNILGQ